MENVYESGKVTTQLLAAGELATAVNAAMNEVGLSHVILRKVKETHLCSVMPPDTTIWLDGGWN